MSISEMMGVYFPHVKYEIKNQVMKIRSFRSIQPIQIETKLKNKTGEDKIKVRYN